MGLFSGHLLLTRQQQQQQQDNSSIFIRGIIPEDGMLKLWAL